MLPRRILLIDDDADIREVTRLTLELTEGWAVMSANGGPAGIVLASSMVPDAILLDVMMPEMDGPDTLRALRLQPITHDTPVIFLTAKVREADRGHYLKLGVQGVLSKPFDPLRLGQQIKDLLWWS